MSQTSASSLLSLELACTADGAQLVCLGILGIHTSWWTNAKTAKRAMVVFRVFICSKISSRVPCLAFHTVVSVHRPPRTPRNASPARVRRRSALVLISSASTWRVCCARCARVGDGRGTEECLRRGQWCNGAVRAALANVHPHPRFWGDGNLRTTLLLHSPMVGLRPRQL